MTKRWLATRMATAARDWIAAVPLCCPVSCLSLSALPLCLISAHRSPLLSTSLERQRSGSSWGPAIVRPPVSQRQEPLSLPSPHSNPGQKGEGAGARGAVGEESDGSVCESARTAMSGEGRGKQTNKQTKQRIRPRGRLKHGFMGISSAKRARKAYRWY